MSALSSTPASVGPGDAELLLLHAANVASTTDARNAKRIPQVYVIGSSGRVRLGLTWATVDPSFLCRKAAPPCSLPTALPQVSRSAGVEPTAPAGPRHPS